jgi:hypothetical protein|eukprot:SAG25_NODE_143_length_14049_cov_6.050817_2_plen_166_part_00
MEDAQLTRLAQRITDITNLRTVHHELCALLTVGEQLELRVSEMFAPFAHLTALATSEYSQPTWDAAVGEYEAVMAPVEQRIAEKLKEQLESALLPSLRTAVDAHRTGGGHSGAHGAAQAPHSHGPQPQQLLRGMARCRRLRPVAPPPHRAHTPPSYALARLAECH